jgi:hypothetical protein
MRSSLRLLAFLALVNSFSPAVGAEPADKCFGGLPYGCFVVQSQLMSHEQTATVARKLGVSVKRLSNTTLSVQGRQIQVNILDVETDADAAKLYETLFRMKNHRDFCLKMGKRVVEYVGDDPAIAAKTSYELGFLKKPMQIRYRLTARISTIDKADYMSLNQLFNLFLAMDGKNPGAEVDPELTSLTKRFQFGNSLTMRSAGLGRSKAVYRFSPDPSAKPSTRDDVEIYRFDNLPQKAGVPYVTATVEISADESGTTLTTRKADRRLLAATEFWPSDDPVIVAGARKITRGKETAEDKVQAILEWLAPNKNVKFGGPITGSRWGVKKVIQQRFGQCWDFSDCFITLCRASGVPCRQVGGWLYGTSGHIWAEYLDGDNGWKQVDPTGGGKLRCGIYHIPYFTSESGEMPILYVSMPKIEIIETK